MLPECGQAMATLAAGPEQTERHKRATSQQANTLHIALRIPREVASGRGRREATAHAPMAVRSAAEEGFD
jgi:hypothetical protein